MIFNVIGKKNNQTSVSDADREIPTQGFMDYAGNLVLVRISRSASETSVRFYFSTEVTTKVYQMFISEV